MSAIHQIPHTELTSLIPQLDYDSARELRSQLARQTRPGQGWQEALNAWSRATDQRPGEITMHLYRTCPQCHGRMFNTRTLGACFHCRNGKVWTNERFVVRHASVAP